MIRIVIAGLAIVLAYPCEAATGERAFAARMLKELQAAAPDKEMRIGVDDPLTIEVKQDGEWGEASINLHRLEAYCASATAEDCDAVAADFARRITADLPEFAAADLRVIVRDEVYLDYILETLPADTTPPHRQIGEDLFAILAFDSPEAIALAPPGELSDLGLDDDAAWELASAQTRVILPSLPDGADLARSAVAFEDYEYLPSLLTDIEAWRDIAAEAGPDLFVTAVSDHFVFVGVLPDGPDLERLKRTVREDCAAQERCISPNVYRFRDGRWVIAN